MEISLRQALDSDIDFLLNLRDITMGQYLKDCGLPITKDAYLSRILYEFEHAKLLKLMDLRLVCSKQNLTKNPTNGILSKFKFIQTIKIKK